MKLRSLMDDMLETCMHAPGIGLAAIQVGVPKRVIVIDLSREDEKKNPLYFVNPEIITKSNKMQLMKKAAYLYQDNLQKLIDQINVK